MKRIFQLVTLAALALSLNSCGLLGALGRSAGRVVQSTASVLNGGQ